MDTKTEGQYRAEISGAWMLVDQYKQAFEELKAKLEAVESQHPSVEAVEKVTSEAFFNRHIRSIEDHRLEAREIMEVHRDELVSRIAAVNEKNAEQAFILAATEKIDSLTAENEKLRSKLAAGNVSIGVGNGQGKLFVHGDYSSIKSVQDKIFELEELRAKMAEMDSLEPVAWGAFYRKGNYSGQLHRHDSSEDQIDRYIAIFHRSNGSITLRKGRLYAKPVPADKPEVGVADSDLFCDTHCTWRDHHPDCPSHDSK